MKVQFKLQSKEKISSPTAFKANSRIGLYGANTTYFFRDDINWERFGDFLIKRYKDVKKVHVYDYACSEGAETFSIAMILIKKLGYNAAKKFFPIMASDRDKQILVAPKRGIIRPSRKDLASINRNIGSMSYEFMNVDSAFSPDSSLHDDVCQGQVSLMLRKCVQFRWKNLLKDIDKIEKENSVVLCRNVWPYLSEDDKKCLAEKLCKQLGDNSVLIVGDFDRIKKIDRFFPDRSLIHPVGDSFEAENIYSENNLCYVRPK